MYKDRFQLISIPLALLIAGLFIYHNHLFYHDDAYITLRYVYHFINNQGIVWNPGEYVQGYTNFLHLMLISLLGFLKINLVTASQIIGFLSIGGLAALMHLTGKNLMQDSNLPIKHIPLILVLASAPLLIWAIGGLEATLFGLLATASCYSVVRSMMLPSNCQNRYLILAGLLGGLSYLARPDGAVIVAATVGWLAFSAYKSKDVRALFTYSIAMAIIVLPYMTWQFLYYGDIVPNTFYAKSGAPVTVKLVSGIKYIIRFFITPPFLPLLLASSLALVTIQKKWDAHLRYLGVVISAYFLFVLWAGGDHMQAYRFMVPVIPLMSMMLGISLQYSLNPRNERVPVLLTALVIILLSAQFIPERLNPKTKDPAAEVGTVVGEYIAQTWPKDSLIALSTAGSTPFHAMDNRYIDMLGLNDPVISHRKIEEVRLPWQRTPGHLKGDGNYILSREPDYIILGPAQGTQADRPWFLSDIELAENPMFEQLYEKYTVTIDRAQNDNASVKTPLEFTYYQHI